MRRIGVRAHGVTLNLACDFEPLLEYGSDSGTTSLSGSTRTATRIFSCVLAGHTMEKTTAAERFDREEIERDPGTEGIRLYRYGTDNLAGQAPASFKDVRRAVDAMTAFHLIRLVVRLRPMAVLKG